MTDAEYLTTQQALVEIGARLIALDLDAFIARADHALALAPIADPTLFRRGAGTLGAIRRLAVDARKMRERALDLRGTALDRMVAEAEAGA